MLFTDVKMEAHRGEILRTTKLKENPPEKNRSPYFTFFPLFRTCHKG